MNGPAVTYGPFLAYWRALARAWDLIGLPCPSLAEAIQSWEAGRHDWREAPALYSGKVAQ